MTRNKNSYQNILDNLTTHLNSVGQHFQSNAWFGLVKGGMVFPTQPLQVIIRTQQKQTHNSHPLKNITATTRSIISTDGWRAFMRGVTPAATKESFKYLTYKGPLLTGAPDIVSAYWPLQSGILPSRVDSGLKVAAAGVFAGMADTAFGGMLEGWATFRATSNGDQAGAKFKNEFKGKSPSDVLRRLYKGAGAATIKGSVAFTTFFGISPYVKTFFNQVYGVESKPTWYGQLSAALLTGGAVALTSSPFDIAKTISQMPNPSNKSTYDVVKRNFTTHGYKGLTAGLGAKAVMVAMGWSVNFFFVEGIKQRMNQVEEISETPQPTGARN